MVHTLIPAIVSFNLGSQEVITTDVQMGISFTNGSAYEECMLKDGKKGYLLKKGGGITQKGTFNIVITKTPDGKNDDSIKAVEAALKKTQDNDKPDSYTDSMTFVVKNSGDQQFMNLTFSGYVSEFVGNTPKETDFSEYTATLEVFDPASITIGN